MSDFLVQDYFYTVLLVNYKIRSARKKNQVIWNQSIQLLYFFIIYQMKDESTIIDSTLGSLVKYNLLYKVVKPFFNRRQI